jgi:6-phosphogluconolactonase (cycloisomerase 2 family)
LTKKTSISCQVRVVSLNLGTEGTEAISSINCSQDGKYVSICERNVEGEKGLVTIYEIISSKKR